MGAMLALVRKDLQIFFGDRRAVILSFAVPIVIASFFGSIFNGAGGGSEPAKISVIVVDEDGSSISKAIVTGMQKDTALSVTAQPLAQAKSSVQAGSTAVAVVIPAGFGETAGRAFLARGTKPEVARVRRDLRCVDRLAFQMGRSLIHV